MLWIGEGRVKFLVFFVFMLMGKTINDKLDARVHAVQLFKKFSVFPSLTSRVMPL